jgi:hypothetical protein
MFHTNHDFNSFIPLSFESFRKTAGNSIDRISSGGNIPAREIVSVISQAVPHCSYWQARYLFSHAKSPDLVAKEEWNKYEEFIKNLTEKIDEAQSEIIETLQSIKELTEKKFAVDWNIEYYKSKPIKKILKNFAGGLAGILKSISRDAISEKLFVIQMYPSWSVKRKK